MVGLVPLGTKGRANGLGPLGLVGASKDPKFSLHRSLMPIGREAPLIKAAHSLPILGEGESSARIRSQR